MCLSIGGLNNEAFSDTLYQIPYKFEQAHSANIVEEFANLRR
ncbi:hypothetical protein SAMN04488121_102659 [Chitinophaga filiformis]|uniref:Uncharacterized protein n=1 Tax=Chitinophaga filiformis TaxID=104663 RepID=A0A1G7N4F6_CHIFI|nr:hypothetical protein SAMN04488121_102659 [Chitinophaga filiformis]